MSENINDLFKDIRITPENCNQTETVIINVNSSPIATLGNISASVGKAKSGKTFNVSALVSSVLSNSTILKYSANMPETKKRIIYVDTEQSKYHCHKVLNRIINLSKVNNLIVEDNLYYVSVREYTPNLRVKIIEEILDSISNIGLVIIDGCRDLLYDFNCPTESSNLINLLMKWASKHNIHIHVVLHQNKNDDNTRGHLGTELNNKAETILQISKKQNDTVQYLVRPLFTRDIEFAAFSYIITKDGLPNLIEYSEDHTINRRKFKLDNITEEQHQQALVNAFEEPTIQGYNNLITKLKQGYAKIGLDLGDNKIKILCNFLKKNNYIVLKQNKYYVVNKINKKHE